VTNESVEHVITPYPWECVRRLASRFEGTPRPPGALEVLRVLGYEVVPGYRSELAQAVCAPGRALADHDNQTVIFLYDLDPLERERVGFHEVGHALIERLRREHGDRVHFADVEKWCRLVSREAIRRGLARLDE
jgi:hypothetical protein